MAPPRGKRLTEDEARALSREELAARLAAEADRWTRRVPRSPADYADYAEFRRIAREAGTGKTLPEVAGEDGGDQA